MSNRRNVSSAMPAASKMSARKCPGRRLKSCPSSDVKKRMLSKKERIRSVESEFPPRSEELRKKPSYEQQSEDVFSGMKRPTRGSTRRPAAPEVTPLAMSQSDTKITEMQRDTVAQVSRTLIMYKWFHGVMPRDEINGLLLAEGDFLVRKTTEKNRPFICLSVKHNNDARHFPIQFENGQCFLKNMSKDLKFADVGKLIEFLVERRFPLANAICVRSISRPDYYILHDDIFLESKLGSGAFGEVWKGRLNKIIENNKSHEIDVAVKRMKGNPTKALTTEFVKEAKLMRSLQHQNIVMVHGVAPSEEPLMIVIELAANGCLKSFLKKTPTCPIEKLVQFATDAARGMAYLSCQLIIHRDLAARNLLLGQNFEVKISDFGLSEIGKKEIKINKMKLPTRWLSPETFDTGIFTTKTDVWSFAVTLWELFSHCATDPFPGLTNPQAKEQIRLVTPPMQAPPISPPVIVNIMLECFNKDPSQRPPFYQILKKLSPKEDTKPYENDEQHTQQNNSDSSALNSSPMPPTMSMTGHTPGVTPPLKKNKSKAVSKCGSATQTKSPLSPVSAKAVRRPVVPEGLMVGGSTMSKPVVSRRK